MWGLRSAVVMLSSAAWACGGEEASVEPAPASVHERRVEVAPRIPFLVAYPCGAQCHDARSADATPRELTGFHAGRRVVHGPAIDFCDDCHALESPDDLRTMDGELVSFDESDRICGQCHGEKHRDWLSGMHGSVTGGWRGVVVHRQCTACHDPHTPSRITLEALPPPTGDPRAGGGA